jgi:hypothetical protein
LETVAFYALADELNVSVQFLKDMVRAGVLKTRGNRILKESADELRWHLATHKFLLPEPEDEQ